MIPLVDIIHIGQLAANPFWNEQDAVRPPVATTVLVSVGDRRILVDPSLPAPLLTERLKERTGLTPDDVDAVFMTTFHPNHRRALALFDEADWLIGPIERERAGRQLQDLLDADDGPDEILIEQELAVLGRMDAAEDQLAPSVDLFPLPGVSAGLCGLLVAGLHTTVITGDAVLTRAHYEHSQAWEQAEEIEQAQQSLAELVEIADVVVPGHDNLFVASARV